MYAVFGQALYDHEGEEEEDHDEDPEVDDALPLPDGLPWAGMGEDEWETDEPLKDQVMAEDGPSGSAALPPPALAIEHEEGKDDGEGVQSSLVDACPPPPPPPLRKPAFDSSLPDSLMLPPSPPSPLPPSRDVYPSQMPPLSKQPQIDPSMADTLIMPPSPQTPAPILEDSQPMVWPKGSLYGSPATGPKPLPAPRMATMDELDGEIARLESLCEMGGATRFGFGDFA